MGLTTINVVRDRCVPVSAWAPPAADPPVLHKHTQAHALVDGKALLQAT